jgi:hypothetical protein
MNGTHRFRVECRVIVTEDDVWDYLETVENEDIEKMQKDGYELTEEDYRDTAEHLFWDEDFDYNVFREEH